MAESVWLGDVTNKQLLFKFALGSVAGYKGFKVNCVEHTTSAKTQREHAKIKKGSK